MNIGSYDSDSISTLFSSLSTSSSSSSSNSMSSIYDNLSELSSIKSGNYHKLLKKYYAENSDDDSSASSSTSTSESTTKELAKIESTSEDLISASGDLYKSSSLFKKDSDGNYDTDKIYEAVSAFVDSYNTAIKASSSSEVTGIANASASMVNINNTNASLLKQVGITMNSSTYQLSLDEESFKTADMSTVKSLFSGTGSYAYQIGAQASMVNSYAEIEAGKSNTYTGSGSYSSTNSSGSIYDSLI